MVIDPRKFLFLSDYPTEQIIHLRKYSITIPAYDYRDVSFAHGLPFTPLLIACYSTTSDFLTTYGIGGGERIGASLEYATAISSDSSNIYLNLTNNTASSITLYFNIVGFPSVDSPDVDISPTADESNIFIFNTDYNYCKLALENRITIGTGSTSQSVNHGLGFIPQVLCWRESNGKVSPISVASLNQDNSQLVGGVSIAVSENNIIFNSNLLSPETIYYKVFADE